MGIATTSMLKSVAFAAAVASATAFAPAAVGPATRGNTAVCANKFGQQAPAGAPAADLFNIWRDDYMLTPAEAAAEEAERKANAFFDGVLPPFSNIGNTAFGSTPDAPTLRGIGLKADFSTANPTSAYDTTAFGKASIINKDIIANPKTKEGPEAAAIKTMKAEEGRESYAARSLANFGRWRSGQELDETRRFDSQQTAGVGKANE